jgi:hypothetical protein
MYTYAAEVWDFSLVQGPFSVAPWQTLTPRFTIHPPPRPSSARPGRRCARPRRRRFGSPAAAAARPAPGGQEARSAKGRCRDGSGVALTRRAYLRQRAVHHRRRHHLDLHKRRAQVHQHALHGGHLRGRKPHQQQRLSTSYHAHTGQGYWHAHILPGLEEHGQVRRARSTQS